MASAPSSPSPGADSDLYPPRPVWNRRRFQARFLSTAPLTVLPAMLLMVLLAVGCAPQAGPGPEGPAGAETAPSSSVPAAPSAAEPDSEPTNPEAPGSEGTEAPPSLSDDESASRLEGPPPDATPHPPRPEEVAALVPTLNQWLAAGGTPAALKDLAVAWDIWAASDDLHEADLDGDGAAEYLFPARWLPAPRGDAQPLNVPTYLLALRHVDGSWQVEALPVPGPYPPQAGGEESVLADDGPHPVALLQLVATPDLNGDGRAEVVTRSGSCGAHTCFFTFSVLQRHANDGWQQLLVATNIPQGQAQVVDGELRIEERGIGSVGAGPQRREIQVYRWDGSALVLAEHRFGPSPYAHFHLTDGNAAASAGRLDEARRLYRQLLDPQEDLQYWADPELEAPFLRALARFRLLVLAAREQQAEVVRERTAAALEHDGPYARWTRAFVQAAGKDGTQWEEGCRAAMQSWGLDSQQPPAYWGYSHPSFGPESLCPETAALPGP